MKVHEALYSYLSTYAGLTALISTRVYPLIIPQGATLPSIAYQEIWNNRTHNLGNDTGHTRIHYEFSIYSTTYNSVKSVAKQLRLALQNYSGVMGGVGGVTVQAVILHNEFDGFDEESKEYYAKLEFEIFVESEEMS